MQPQIAIVNESTRIDDAVLAYAAKACDAQVMECAAAWGIEPTPVAFYARAEGLPARDVRIMAIVDEMDDKRVDGYHTDALGVIYGRVLAGTAESTSITLSHECLEELVDPTCDKWRPIAGGNRLTALEVCDAVEADVYEVKVEILDGKPRPVLLSNYLLPRWFDPQANGGVGPFDRLATLGAPFTMNPGGYMLVRERGSSEVESVFARGGDVRMAAKRRNPDGRLHRRGYGLPR